MGRNTMGANPEGSSRHLAAAQHWGLKRAVRSTRTEGSGGVCL